MARKKPKFYVVWEGNETGVFDSWDKCKKSIEGYGGAKYKSFPSKSEAEEALKGNYNDYINTGDKKPKKQSKPTTSIFDIPTIFNEAICVDAACSGNPGKMEYRGVIMSERKLVEVFHQGPFEDATNNIGEYLALVHAISYMNKNNISLPIYSDSLTALKWVRAKKPNSALKLTSKNQKIFDIIERATNYLKNNNTDYKMYKWNTVEWGEIPADFGRK